MVLAQQQRFDVKDFLVREPSFLYASELNDWRCPRIGDMLAATIICIG